MWFITDGGKQIPLEVRGEENEHLARVAWEKFLAAAEDLRKHGPPPPDTPVLPPGAGPPSPTVADLAPQYLAVLGGCPRYRKNVRLNLNVLVTAAGTLTPRQVTAKHVERASEKPTWSPSTRCNFVGDSVTFLKWCGVEGPKPKKPRKRSRGAKAVLSDAQVELVLAEARRPNGRLKKADDLAAYLTVLRETGTRPQEVATLTAEEVDWDNALVRRQEHKEEETADRVIHFTAAAMAVLRGQREKWPAGFLFRTRYKKPFRMLEVGRRLREISGRVGFRCFAYQLRHSFATKALAAGVPDAVVAELLGHKGTAMVAHHYGHLNQQAAVLKAAAEKAMRAG